MYYIPIRVSASTSTKQNSHARTHSEKCMDGCLVRIKAACVLAPAAQIGNAVHFHREKS